MQWWRRARLLVHLAGRRSHRGRVTSAVEETSLEDIRPRPQRKSSERHAFGLDANRPEAVGKRRKTGQRTARENLAELVDEGTFVEYGALVVAAQRTAALEGRT